MNVLPNDDIRKFTTNVDNDISSIHYARAMLITVTVLTVFGLTMLYSASYGTAGLKFFRNQLLWLVMGMAGGGVAFVLGYRKLTNYSLVFMGISFVLLLVAALCFPPVNGACRWIKFRLGGMDLSIQPSEFAKIAVALFVAKYCSENLRTFNDLRGRHGMLPLAAVAGMVVGGVLLGKDLGTTVLIATMAISITVAAGLYLRYMIFPAIGATLIGVYIYFFNPTRLARVTSFTQPELVQQDSGYQLWNSLLALGSGNWFGIGFMESRLKAKYLPEAHTDFILAIVGEELGYIGMISVILLYALFTYYALKISLKSDSRLGILLGFGLTVGIVLQAVINISVISGSAPTKGMPAPFISYGGSNLMASLIAIGILLSIAADTASPGYNERYLEIIRSKLSFLPWWKDYRQK